MKIEARKSQTAPNKRCALDACNKRLPDAFGFLLWEDHPEDDRFCSPECATEQFEILEAKFAK